MTGKQPAPLYLLPGLVCTDVIWQAQRSALEPDYDVTAVEGYGDADDLTEMARRVLAMAPERISLAGHSMGARVALEVLRAAPERIERIALIDTGVHGSKPGEAEKRYALLDIGRTKGMAALVDLWLPPMVHPARRQDAALMEPLRRMSIGCGLDQFERHIRALLSRPDARPLLTTINCPALIGVGRQDEWSPLAQHEEMAAEIPSAELVVFEDAGHMAPAEAPDQVTDALRRWLERET